MRSASIVAARWYSCLEVTNRRREGVGTQDFLETDILVKKTTHTAPAPTANRESTKPYQKKRYNQREGLGDEGSDEDSVRDYRRRNRL